MTTEEWEEKGWKPTMEPMLFYKGWRVWYRPSGEEYGYLYMWDDVEMTVILRSEYPNIRIYQK